MQQEHSLLQTIQQGYAPFIPIALDQGVIPKHLFGKEVEEGKDLLKSGFNLKPVGLGPFKFVEWRRDERVVFEANPNYWRGRPHLDRVIYRIIPDSNVIGAELEAGGIDMLPGADAKVTARLQNNPNFVVDVRNGIGWMGVIPNVQHPLLSDRRMRQALMMGMDKEKIVKEFFPGAKYATQPISPEVWAHNPNLQPWKQDVDKALALLAEMGYKRAADGKMVGADGKQLSFTILTFDFSRERQEASVAIQEQLGRIGIDIKIELLSSPVLLRRAEAGQFELAYIAYGGFVDPDGTLTRWECANIGAGNISRYCNKEVDELILKARRSTNQEERKQAYWRVQQILRDDLPVLWSTWGSVSRIWNSKLRGWVITPDANGQFKYLDKVHWTE